MDKYKRLLSNTLIFAIGTFSSKVLVFLLVPFYTNLLTEGELGTADLIVQTANLIIPMVSIGMSNAIIRYGLDKYMDKRDVFTGAITAILSGYAIFLVLLPFLSRIPIIGGHTLLIYLYVLTSCLRSLCSQFVRARQLIRLYAFDGVMSTAMVILFNVLFLMFFRMGITGYVLATIVSDLCSSLFLFTIAGLHRYIRFRDCDWSVLKSMIRYAAPLIPTTTCWWITNVSDRYMVTYFLDAGANGLLTIAYKVPTIITLLSGIFTDAWQMSAFTEDGPGRTRFFSNVFNAYQALIFSAASGLILFSKLITSILVLGSSNPFYESWQYIPFLLLATCFSCFVTFLGSIYMVEKKSMATLATTALGAAINVLLNLLLIPRFGINGGTFATFFSYLIVFIVRMVDTHRIIPMHWNLPKLLANLLLLLGQTWVLLCLDSGWILWEVILCILVLALNFRQILINLQRFLTKRAG